MSTTHGQNPEISRIRRGIEPQPRGWRTLFSRGLMVLTVLLSLFVLAPFVSQNSAESETITDTELKGDYDGDGRLTAKDALAALKMSVGGLEEDLNLDMDGNGQVATEDARRLLIAAMGTVLRVSSGNTPPTFDFGKVLDSGEGPVSGSDGISLALQGGSRLDIPAVAIDGETTVRLMKSEVPAIAGKQDLLSHVYYMASTERPRIQGDFTLTIPYDRNNLPPGVSEDSIQAYALFGGSVLYPVSGIVDKARQVVIINDPEVAVLSSANAMTGAQKRAVAAPVTDRYPARQAPQLSSQTGYVLGKPDVLGSTSLKCEKGTPGEVHEEDGSVFRILFLVPAPCSFAEFVSDTLMEAYNTYNATYTDDDGNPPFAHLSPQNRMVVQLGNFSGVNGQYNFLFSWNGYIQIDVASGLNKQAELRDTLFHEMFHAVQDIYSNMAIGGVMSMWWYEATAEWAGMTGRGLPFVEMVKKEFSTFPYVLSVPIQKSRSYAGGSLSYGDSLFIEHVQKQKPDYLREALNTWKTTSGQMYDHMVASGKLAQTYPDFIKDILTIVPYADVPDPWTQARIFESDAETRIFTRPTAEPGDTGESVERLTDSKQRSADHRFSISVAPLTTRFFEVKTATLREARTIEVKLIEGGAPSDKAWLMTTLPSGVSGSQAPPVRLSATGSSFPGLGKGYGSLWIAVFNPDPDEEIQCDLILKIAGETKPSPTPSSTISYRLQGAPAINYINKPGAGVTATISANSAVYTYPDTVVGAVTKTVSWNDLPQEIQPNQNYSIAFKSTIGVAKADPVTLNMMNRAYDPPRMEQVETYATIESDPFFRVIAAFSPTLMPDSLFQYSPDGGGTWKSPVSSAEAWERYYEKGMKQVVTVPNGIW
ncbi:MAG: hypothetical protein FJZ95_06590, partial [Chloroflexi bacterium]|nr:hypothetical protein [Chloroflexota bacterium]